MSLRKKSRTLLIRRCFSLWQVKWDWRGKAKYLIEQLLKYFLLGINISPLFLSGTLRSTEIECCMKNNYCRNDFTVGKLSVQMCRQYLFMKSNARWIAVWNWFPFSIVGRRKWEREQLQCRIVLLYSMSSITLFSRLIFSFLTNDIIVSQWKRQKLGKKWRRNRRSCCQCT